MTNPSFLSSDAVRLGLIAPEEATALEPLLGRCGQVEVEAGAVVLEGHSPNSTAYLVLQGSLSVLLQRDGEAEVGRIGSGELVGEVSTLTGTPTSAWVIAREPARLLALDRQILMALADQSHRFAQCMLQTVCGRLYSSNLRALSSDNASKAYRRKAFFDQLTGLRNRAWLSQHLPDLLAALQQADTGLHFYMVDIDHFKHFNDNWGHAIGDRVLVAVGQALEAAIGPDSHVVRVGGEEILVLVAGCTSPGDAAETGERLRRAVAQQAVPVESQPEPLQVTISVGGARHQPGEPGEATLERADQALYRAKEGGRNRVELA